MSNSYSIKFRLRVASICYALTLIAIRILSLVSLNTRFVKLLLPEFICVCSLCLETCLGVSGDIEDYCSGSLPVLQVLTSGA